MNMREKLLEEIRNYVPFNQQEEADKKTILYFLENFDDIFYRDNLIAHMTASCWLTNKTRDRVFMAYHNIYDSWAWLGGHADGDEDLLHVAIKEAKEESSLADVKPVTEDIFSLEILSVDSHIKKGKYVPTHLHLNVTYLLEADDSAYISNKADENSAVGWFDKDEAVQKSNEKWFKENIYSKLNEKMKMYE